MFVGAIKNSTKEFTVCWPARLVPLRRAPNVIIMANDWSTAQKAPASCRNDLDKERLARAARLPIRRKGAWGLLLILLTVVFHAYNLGLIDQEVSSKLTGSGHLRHLSYISVLVIGGTVLSVTILHGIEGFIWAGAYRFLGALPDTKSAMLYSLNAMTSYGHANLYLAPRWEMMGALEALNGWILFGLTTAFLFTVIQKAWPYKK